MTSTEIPQVFVRVLRRMGEILGPGAVSALVQHAAAEEGAAMAASLRPGDSKRFLEMVDQLFELETTLEGAEGRTVTVHAQLPDYVRPDDVALFAFLAGLIEGGLNSVTRVRRHLARQPFMTDERTLELVLEG